MKIRVNLISSILVLTALFLFFSKGFCPIPESKTLRWIFPALLAGHLILKFNERRLKISGLYFLTFRLALFFISIIYLSKVSSRFYQTDSIGALFSEKFSWVFLADRIVLYFSILTSFYCVGALFFSKFWKSNKSQPALLSTFLGTSIVYFAVYLALAINLKKFYIAKFMLLSALAANFLREIIILIKNRPEKPYALKKPLKLTLFLYLLFFVFSIDVFFGKIVNPFHRDGDVWLHYLPYYLEVFKTGTWGPGELWYHFYCSKGAILQFLTLYFSGGDIYSLRIFQYLFFILSSLFLLNQIPKKSQKSIFLVALTVVILLIKASPHWGNFGKNHEILFSSVMIIMGGIFGYISCNNKHQNLFLIVFYSIIIGLLIPPISLPLCCALIASSFLASKKYIQLKHILQISALFVGLQILCQIFYNLWQTGLMMETPIRITWSLSNQEKIKKFFDPYLVQYLILGTSKKLGSINVESFLSSYNNIFLLLKVSDAVSVFGLFFILICILTYKNIITAMSIKALEKTPAELFLVLFIFCTLFFGLLTGQTTSLARILSFAALGIALFLAARIFFVLVNLSFYKTPVLKKLPIFLLYFVFVGFGIDTHSSYGSKTTDVLSWLSGKTNTIELSSKINPAAFSWQRLKSKISPAENILSCTIISGPENVTQGVFVKSEVSHSFGPDWSKMVFGSNDESISVLKKYNIKYIVVEKSAFLFGAFPFSDYASSFYLCTNKHKIFFEDNFLLCLENSSEIQVGKQLKKQNDQNNIISLKDYLRKAIKPENEKATIKMETLYRVTKDIWLNNKGNTPIQLPIYLPENMGWQ